MFETLVLGFELFQRLLKPLRDANILAFQLSHQFVIVVSGDAVADAGGDNAHGELEHFGRVRSAIYKVAEKNEFAVLRMADPIVSLRPPAAVRAEAIRAHIY